MKGSRLAEQLPGDRPITVQRRPAAKKSPAKKAAVVAKQVPGAKAASAAKLRRPKAGARNTTALAAAAGGIAASFASWIMLKKPDLSMALNGILAGLVGITAGADSISPWASVVVGGIAGVLVVVSVLALDKIKIDDPVGAISVHGICGNWGTIAVGIFGAGSFVTQLIGTVAISAFAFVFALVTFLVVKAIFGLRVSPEEEEGGLDIGEHGQESYPDFVPNK